MIQNYNLSQILKKALSHGGDFSEIFFEKSDSTQVQCEEKKIERLQVGTDMGVGIRVLFGGETAYAYTNDFTEPSLLMLADSVAAAVKAKKFDRDINLTTQSPSWKNAVQVEPSGIPFDQKVEQVLKANKTAWAVDTQIRQVSVSYRDQIRQILVANSEGQLCEDHQVYTVFVVQVVAGSGDVIQTGYEPVGGTVGFEIFKSEDPEKVALLAAKQALLMLKARKAPAGRMPVVLSSEAGGTMIHEAVGHGLEADLAYEELSVYKNKIGSRIASPLVTVWDDKTVPGKRGSFVFDDEGTPAQKTVLVENGILKTYMYNRLYAGKASVASTGNGRRQSYRNRPIVRMTNTMIAPGKDNPEEIIRSVESGLFVKKMGGGQVNTVNGDFMFEVTEGYLLEKGKIGEPVRGATLTGNGPEILNLIDKVGTDLGFGIGTCGKDGQGVPVADAQPTIRIPEIVVGGAA
ncbi:MAG: TldD/PmbA family protein [bacterium]